MHFTKEEVKILKSIISFHLKSLEEKKTIAEYPTPEFLSGEVKYEDVLRTIKQKLNE